MKIIKIKIRKIIMGMIKKKKRYNRMLLILAIALIFKLSFLKFKYQTILNQE